MGSSKKKSLSSENGDAAIAEMTHAEKLKFVCKIAKPMAGKKLTKKIHKLVKKASKNTKENIVHGVKSVQRSLRRKEKGLVVLAGDVNPIDIICHIPAVCEDLALPYIYVPSRKDLGSSMGTLRSLLMVIVKPKPDYQELYDECVEEITAMPQPVWIGEPEVEVKIEPIDVE